MTFHDLIQSLSSDTLRSLVLYRPELALVATIVLILLLKVFRITAAIDSYHVALLGSVAGLWFAIRGLNPPPTEAFTGLLVFDSFSGYIRLVLFGFLVLFCLFTRISGIPDREAATDFYPLVFGATLGMCMMATANHMLTIFLAVEMASVPSYVLAGALKGRRKSSEAALKYVIFGAGAAGVMLYGISLLAGVLGSVHLPTMAVRLADLFAHQPDSQEVMVLALGGLMMLVGLAFKLSAVPFHFWCPDVFEGASAEIDAFLSVASKAGALALLVRVAIGFGVVGASYEGAPLPEPVAPVAFFNVQDGGGEASDVASPGVEQGDAAGSADENDPQGADETAQDIADEPAPAQPTVQAAVPASAGTLNRALAPVRTFIAEVLALMAVVTCTFGNLAAYGQTNIKRLLAYSTIAHAGYMIMPVAAAMVLAGEHPTAANEAIAGLAFYIGIYLFTNLGVFAVVAFLRNALRSEEIADYAGLIGRAPMLVVCFGLLLVSLIGLPPLAGFFGKFWIFASLVDARLWTVLVIGGLNTAISLYYYLRVIKIMAMDAPPESRLPFTLSFVPVTFVVFCTVPVLVPGIWPDSLARWLETLTSVLFT